MLHYFLHGWCCTMYSQQESSANNNFQFYQQLAIIIQQYNVQILNSRRERESPESIAKGYQSSYRQSDKRMTLAPPKLLMQLRFVCCLASKSQIKMIDFNCICFQTLFVLRQGLLYRWTEHSILPISTGGGLLTPIMLHKLTQSL